MLDDGTFVILVVEDSASALKLLSYHLKRQGFEVQSATNGLEAVEILKTTQVDLIISDYMMPEMDGEQLARYVAGNPELRHIPFMLLTAKGENQIQDLSNVVAEVLGKPYEPEQVVSRVKAILSRGVTTCS